MNFKIISLYSSVSLSLLSLTNIHASNKEELMDSNQGSAPSSKLRQIDYSKNDLLLENMKQQQDISSKIQTVPFSQGSAPLSGSDSNTPSRKKWNWQDYIEASVTGIVRGVAGLPIEHPLDCIKTHLQAHPQISSGVLAAQNIYNAKGIRGFFNGVLPNGFRAATKQSYRYPLMFYLPNMYKDMLPSDFEERNSAVKKTLTGLTIAGLETYILCPLERLKVYLMTSEKVKSHSILGFLNDNKATLRMELFRGLNAMLPKQVVSWTTFLVADHKVKSLAHQWTGVPLKEELPFWTLMASGTMVGIINTAATLPFDSAKTQLQMSQHLNTTRLRDAVASVYKQHGFMGLYRGWQVRMLQYVLHSMFTVTVLEKLEKK